MEEEGVTVKREARKAFIEAKHCRICGVSLRDITLIEQVRIPTPMSEVRFGPGGNPEYITSVSILLTHCPECGLLYHFLDDF